MRWFIIFLVLFSVKLTAAADLKLYDDAVLEAWKERTQANVQWNFDTLIIGNLTPAERRSIGKVDLMMPLRAPGEMGDDPMTFYAAPGRIVAPAKSIRFFSDMAIAIAYYEVKGGDIQTVYDYMAMLKYRSPEDMEGGRFLPPLEALGVPAEAWKEDALIDDLSQKILKSALFSES